VKFYLITALLLTPVVGAAEVTSKSSESETWTDNDHMGFIAEHTEKYNDYFRDDKLVLRLIIRDTRIKRKDSWLDPHRFYSLHIVHKDKVILRFGYNGSGNAVSNTSALNYSGQIYYQTGYNPVEKKFYIQIGIPGIDYWEIIKYREDEISLLSKTERAKFKKNFEEFANQPYIFHKDKSLKL
jgi:hypothetical protein